MRTLVACSTLAFVLALGAAHATAGNLQLELVGAVSNTPTGVTPAISTQYGYLSYALGLAVFRAQPENETSAIYTFYAQATTIRVLPDGPLRVITRVGTFTIYRHPTLTSSFDDPNSFRVGEAVLVSGFRQQVVVDTVAQTFTTLNRSTITAVNPFKAGARTIRLGVVGGHFNTILNGHLNMPGPPSGYFAGYTVSTP